VSPAVVSRCRTAAAPGPSSAGSPAGWARACRRRSASGTPSAAR
jgi:hypothetical protein